MMRRNKWISICLIVSLLALSGCGSTETVSDEVVELKDPVDGEVGWLTEKVVRRNMYSANIYTATVQPEIVEYTYEVGQSSVTYGVMPGDKVEAGDVLMMGDTESVDERIANMEERLALLAENYQEYQTEMLQTIAELEWNVGYYEQIFRNMDAKKPEQYITDGAGNKAVNPQYTAWEKELDKWNGMNNLNDLDLWYNKEEYQKETDLYHLDYQYYSGLLKDLKAQKSSAALRTDICGEVVGMLEVNPSTAVKADIPVAAVADLSKLSIRCEYIPRRNIMYYAKEVYAFINGVRYEITYADNGDTSGTTFYFVDENVQVEAGEDAMVVLENNSRNQIIAVDKDALYVDSSGHYVYVVENGETIQKNVKIGISDGFYTEIMSGLEEGEEVLVSEKPEAVNTAVLERGNVERTLSKSGYLTYPVEYTEKNPVEYGTCYFGEFLVEQYQYVEAGQPIATVRVAGDMVELARMETELQRDKERLEDVKAKVTEENAESYAERIAREQEAIDEREAVVTKMRTDYETVEICAEHSGVVMALLGYTEEQIVKSGSTLLYMADPNYGFLALENVANLSYGDVMDITYKNASKQEVASTARVVTMGTPGVSKNLDSGYKYLQISSDVLKDMLEALKSQGGRYNMSKISAKGVINAMENVVRVPKEAVTVKDGITYVNVLNEDGSIVPTCFLSGGSDNKFYWVIEGLTEGMTICWE